MKYAKVIIDAVLPDNIAWDYLIPCNLNVVRGSCVIVPFGKREIVGFVIDLGIIICNNTVCISRKKGCL